jgi:hypothetical protein
MVNQDFSAPTLEHCEASGTSSRDMTPKPARISIPLALALSFLVFVGGTFTGFIGGLACDENIPSSRQTICTYAGTGSSLALLSLVPPVAMLTIALSTSRRVAALAAAVILLIEATILIAVLTIGV